MLHAWSSRGTKNRPGVGDWRRRRGRPLPVEPLEGRLMLHGAIGGEDFPERPPLEGPNLAIDGQHILPDYLLRPDLFPPPAAPEYHSLDGAPVAVYLDFNGYVGSGWWFDRDDDRVRDDGEVVTDYAPIFDLDGNPNLFSQTEADLIYEIWQRVSEDFAPFNIDVTTEDPHAWMLDENVLTVAIGGAWDDWSGTSQSGVARIGGFARGTQPVAYVFAENVIDWVRPWELGAALATTASHEAGHAFGLKHQSLFDLTDGTLVEEYYRGTRDWTPIMGGNLSADRTTWSNGAVDVAIVPTRGVGGGRFGPPNPNTVQFNITMQLRNFLVGCG